MPTDREITQSRLAALEDRVSRLEWTLGQSGHIPGPRDAHAEEHFARQKQIGQIAVMVALIILLGIVMFLMQQGRVAMQ